jgi:hypothetical protein
VNFHHYVKYKSWIRGFKKKKTPSFDGLHHSSKLATVAWGFVREPGIGFFFCREEPNEIHQFYE